MDRGWLQSGQSNVNEVQGGPCNAMRVDRLGHVCVKVGPGWEGSTCLSVRFRTHNPYPKGAGQERNASCITGWTTGRGQGWMRIGCPGDLCMRARHGQGKCSPLQKYIGCLGNKVL